MPISTYGDLQDAVYKWLLRDNTDVTVTPAQMANYIALTEAALNRQLKIMDLEKAFSFNTDPAYSFISLPANFRGIITLEFDNSPFDIEYVESRRALKEKCWNIAPGRPRYYTLFGNQIFFGPAPDGVYAMTMDYYQAIPALDGSTITTNNILQKFPDAYLYGAQVQALTQIDDNEKLASVGTLFTNIVQAIITESDFNRVPVGSRMRANGRSIG